MALFELLYLNKLKAEKEFPKEDSSKYLFTKIEDANLNQFLKLKNDFHDVKIFKKNIIGHNKRTAFLNQAVNYIKNSDDKNIIRFLNQAEQIVSTYDNDRPKKGIKAFTFSDAVIKMYYIIDSIVNYLSKNEEAEGSEVFNKEDNSELQKEAEKFLELYNNNRNKIKNGTMFKKDTARITKELVNQAVEAIRNRDYGKFSVEQWKMLYKGLEATINEQNVKHETDIETFKKETKEFAKLYNSIFNNLKKNSDKEDKLRSILALDSISDWIKQQKEPKKEIENLTNLFKKLENDLKPFEKAKTKEELDKQLEALTKASDELKEYMK